MSTPTAEPVLNEVTTATPGSVPESSATEAVSPAPTQPSVALKAAESPVDTKAAKEVTEEPQNALTKKFTDAEWKAVKELRTHLPDIFAEAYPEKSDAKTSIVTIWGVTIDPSNPADAKVSVVLVHFLRARNLDISAAKSMLTATLRWREQFKIDEALKEKFPEDIFGKLGYVYGHDKGGRPVTYNLYGANSDLKAVFGDVPRFIRWRVALMEKGVAQLDFDSVDQMVQVHDYEGVTLSSRDANSKNAAAEATTIFQNHYPELLYKKYFVNVPMLLNWIFWIFKPLMSAQTLAKMTVVGSGHRAIGKELLPIIDENELPMRYGGGATAF